MTVRILTGHCLTELEKLPTESVQCVVTSPPFWGLRDYGTPALIWDAVAGCEHDWGHGVRRYKGGPGNESSTINGTSHIEGRSSVKQYIAGRFCQKCGAWEGQLGLEPTPELFISHLVLVFREVRRVLRRDGIAWINMGDSYATGAGAVGDHPGGGEQGARWAGRDDHNGRGTPRRCDGRQLGRANLGPMTQPNRMPIPGLKAKDLVGVPWMLAFALRADGWYLRQDIIWDKPNPMPESVNDRCTKSHEYLFLVTKSERYYYDADAIAEPVSQSMLQQMERGYNGQATKDYAAAGAQDPSATKARILKKSGNKERKPASARGVPVHTDGKTAGAVAGSVPWEGYTRNKRSVWRVTTKPFAGAHFATFPPELIEPCILAGTSERGCCSKCGTPWRRDVSIGDVVDHPARLKRSETARQFTLEAGDYIEAGEALGRMRKRETLGYRANCKCGAPLIPCTVLDPFGGAGTTALVADRNHRDVILIELKPEYVAMSEKRIRGDAPLLVEVST